MWKLGNGVGESEALVTIIHVANRERASGCVGHGPSIGYRIEKAGGKW